MPTQDQVPQIIEKVRQRLAEEAQKGVYLEVVEQKLEGDWLYVVVVPGRSGMRASDHARVMSQIERELRQEGSDQVLLVPALEE